MSADWAKDACEAWNKDPVLTDKLVESGWVANDKGRGYKVMQVYRTDCGDKPKMEAMGNMGPFGNFLLLVGKVPSDSAACPAK
jgi:hypothetical protein